MHTAIILCIFLSTITCVFATPVCADILNCDIDLLTTNWDGQHPTCQDHQSFTISLFDQQLFVANATCTTSGVYIPTLYLNGVNVQQTLATLQTEITNIASATASATPTMTNMATIPSTVLSTQTPFVYQTTFNVPAGATSALVFLNLDLLGSGAPLNCAFTMQIDAQAVPYFVGTAQAYYDGTLNPRVQLSKQFLTPVASPTMNIALTATAASPSNIILSSGETALGAGFSSSTIMAQFVNQLCGPGLTSCGGKCVSLSSDTNNCGGCGIQCSESPACCNAGVCTTCDTCCSYYSSSESAQSSICIPGGSTCPTISTYALLGSCSISLCSSCIAVTGDPTVVGTTCGPYVP